jgi:hypothetical protein
VEGEAGYRPPEDGLGEALAFIYSLGLILIGPRAYLYYRVAGLSKEGNLREGIQERLPG